MLIQTEPLEKSDSVALAISPSEKIISTSSKDGEVHTWNFPSLIPEFTFKLGNLEVRKISFSPNGKNLVACDMSGKVILINLATKGITTLFEHPENEPVRFVTYSPTGNSVAFVAGDGKPYLMDVSTKKILTPNKGHTDMGLCCCYSSDGKYLATGGQDNLIIIWKICLTKLMKYIQIDGHKDAITSLMFTKTRNNLFSASRDEKIKFWKLEDQLL